MKFLAAYLLSSLNEDAAPTKKSIDAILAAVGIDSSPKVESLIKQIGGRPVSELIAAGSAKLASVPSGAVAVAAPVKGAAPSPKKDKKEEKKEEPKEESDDDMGFGLFD